jgi:hypothetical protein
MLTDQKELLLRKVNVTIEDNKIIGRLEKDNEILTIRQRDKVLNKCKHIIKELSNIFHIPYLNNENILNDILDIENKIDNLIDSIKKLPYQLD